MATGLAEVTTLTASQMTFFADDERVTIIPAESMPQLDLLSVRNFAVHSLACAASSPY